MPKLPYHPDHEVLFQMAVLAILVTYSLYSILHDQPQLRVGPGKKNNADLSEAVTDAHHLCVCSFLEIWYEAFALATPEIKGPRNR